MGNTILNVTNNYFMLESTKDVFIVGDVVDFKIGNKKYNGKIQHIGRDYLIFSCIDNRNVHKDEITDMKKR